MNCEIKIDSLNEEEKFQLLPSYLRDFNTVGSCDSFSYSENLPDKIKRLEDELIKMKEKLSKIERVMPWVSETFDMDENKDM